MSGGRPVPKCGDGRGVGYGLPGWLPLAKYLSADETRALGERDLGSKERCSRCGKHVSETKLRVLEKAHIVRKGMGGKKKGTTGPTVRLCVECHDELDDHDDLSLAVDRQDGGVYWLSVSPAGVSARRLHGCGRLWPDVRSA